MAKSELDLTASKVHRRNHVDIEPVSRLKFWNTIGIVLVTGLFTVGVEGALIITPENTVKEVGHTIRLKCSTDSNQSVYWFRKSVGSDERPWIYNGQDFLIIDEDRRFSVDKDESSGRYDLVISNVQMDDAGTYGCVEKTNPGFYHSAELIIVSAGKLKEKKEEL